MVMLVFHTPDSGIMYLKIVSWETCTYLCRRLNNLACTDLLSQVYGWGRGEHGRLGFGDDKSSKMFPQRVQLLVGEEIVQVILTNLLIHFNTLNVNELLFDSYELFRTYHHHQSIVGAGYMNFRYMNFVSPL